MSEIWTGSWVQLEIPACVTGGCKYLYYIFAGRYLGGKAASAMERYAAYMSPEEEKRKRDGKETSVCFD